MTIHKLHKLHKLDNDCLSIITQFLNLNDLSNIAKVLKLNNNIISRYINKYKITNFHLCYHGHLNLLKYYHKIKKIKYTEYEFILASEYGHLEIVKYLYEKKKLNIYLYPALRLAKQYKRHNVVNYLKQIQ